LPSPSSPGSLDGNGLQRMRAERSLRVSGMQPPWSCTLVICSLILVEDDCPHLAVQFSQGKKVPTEMTKEATDSVKPDFVRFVIFDHLTGTLAQLCDQAALGIPTLM